MFAHLDDPEPFVADDDFRRGVLHRSGRLRRRRRLAAVAGGLAATVATVGLAGALYVDRRDAAIDRVDVTGEPSVDGAVNILLIGTDARDGFDEPGAEGVAGARADTIVVVRLQADGTVALLPIPRDLADPATGERINGTIAGGPQALVDGVGSLTGLPIDHYVELDFEGFTGLVDELGGVRVSVSRQLVDHNSGLLLEPSPCVTLDGETALALARARHVEGDLTGDLGRMQRGQAALQALVAQLGESSADPATIDRLSRVLADHATLDDRLTLGRLAELAHALAGAGPERVSSTFLPLVEVTRPDNGVVLELAPEAITLLRSFGAPDDFVVPPPTGEAGGVSPLPRGGGVPDGGIGACREGG